MSRPLPNNFTLSHFIPFLVALSCIAMSFLEVSSM
jgi:hypothetical protein